MLAISSLPLPVLTCVDMKLKQIGLRVTLEENDLIEQAVAESGLSKNGWLRQRIGLDLPDKPGFKRGDRNPKTRQDAPGRGIAGA